ncbi:MAG: signal peptidase I [Actinomycetaceae bacterium]|nr:signal peptidase I [Actinomycetaceae bacterium]
MGSHHRHQDAQSQPFPPERPSSEPEKTVFSFDDAVKKTPIEDDLPPIPEYVEPEPEFDDNEEEEEVLPPIPDYLTPEEEAEADAREEASESRRTWFRSVLEFAGLLAVALIVSVVIKTFFVQAFVVPSGSMETTLNPTDRILVNRLADSPQDIKRGDIIVFSDPNNWLSSSSNEAESTFISRVMETIGLLPADSGQHLVKRVIGVGGDTVECCDVNGRLTVNGVPIDETYLDPGVAPSDFEFSVTVPNGQLWVMGDNRGNSYDSRQHHQVDGNGFVPNSRVVGRVWAVFWPYDEIRMIESGRDAFKNVP